MANELYTPEELEQLNSGKKIRSELVTNLIKNADPGSKYYGSTARVVNELLTSLDKSIHDSANTRLKHQDAQNANNTLDVIADIFKHIHSSSKNLPVRNTVILEDKFLPDDVVPGELDIDQPILEIKDFESNNNKE